MKQERLTKEVELPFGSTYSPKCECIERGSTVTLEQMLAYDGVCAKLGKLENIEDKMGASLIDVLESAMNSFVGIVDGAEATFFGRSVNLNKMTISGVSISGGFGCKVTYKTFKIAEYGKTWARTWRELR